MSRSVVGARALANPGRSGHEIAPTITANPFVPFDEEPGFYDRTTCGSTATRDLLHAEFRHLILRTMLLTSFGKSLSDERFARLGYGDITKMRGEPT